MQENRRDSAPFTTVWYRKYFSFQMDISLKDQIVVLDEAHNVEDSARDSASLTLTAVDLQNTLDDLDRLGKQIKYLYIIK